eukprot:CAMPEP_0204839306 /NCGR_PEP_ID=MMETSP1346-20131115/33717_1 /ASSEMBLY_ACC=CAM_ASM_000771 /TAXON_ID=215587 /ORGANISM="Aplanochytrium stocchinoi, Strain GSBS06" /LENGTH=499 /DNA_ID=CAMNT_0051975925 /DNA_START=108 /DNA_END=1608 /DNA_ORIENTATION=-
MARNEKDEVNSLKYVLLIAITLILGVSCVLMLPSESLAFIPKEALKFVRTSGKNVASALGSDSEFLSNSVKVQRVAYKPIIEYVDTDVVHELPEVQKYSGSDKVEYIYMYKIPHELISASEKTSCWYCMHDVGYNTERTIINAINSSRYITDDPSRATWKLVPMFYACMVDCGPYNPKRGYIYARNIMDYIKSLPYWEEKQGRDHIFIWSQDKGGARIAEYDKPFFMELRKGIFIQTLHSFMPGRPEAFIPSWDIAVPAIAMENEARPIDTLKNTTNKGYYAFWRGGTMPRGLYHFRIQMMKKYSTNEKIHIGSGHSPDYPKELANSRFCLYVPGHVPQRWSGALGNIIKSGCLIMIVNDCTVRPFHDLLPWDMFSASLSEEEFLGANGEGLVEDFATKKLVSIRNNYTKYRKHLMYNLPPKKGDALDMIIESLRLREQQIENKNIYEAEQRKCKEMIDAKRLSVGHDCSILTDEEKDTASMDIGFMIISILLVNMVHI